MKYAVMVSGGVTSFEALRRTLAIHGHAATVPVFADTKIEDGDCYRFLDDIERELGVTLTRLADGRDIWQLFRDRKFIGNTRVDICSEVLKRDLIFDWLKVQPGEWTVVIGFDWTEPHRIDRARARWEAKGYTLWCPLADKPYLLKNDYTAQARSLGIEPPRLYAMGFEHNNCGGACVKGGQGQWKRLLDTLPERYRWHEEQEELTRQVIGKDVAVLRDRRGGELLPLTLRAFRERIEAGQPAQDDLFSCTCME